jgi:hypothetical protein
MKQVFYLLIFFIQFDIFLSSSIGGLKCPDLNLMLIYRRFINNPVHENFENFTMQARLYYQTFYPKSLNLLVRYQNNLTFMISYRNTIKENTLRDPNKISSEYYLKLLEWIMEEIRSILHRGFHFNEPVLREEFTLASCLVKVVQKKILELEFDIAERTLTQSLKDQVEFCKFQIKYISIDFRNQTVDYNALFRLINEIRIINASYTSLQCIPMSLSKRYAMLWTYIYYIWKRDCMVIFDRHHQSKIPILYLLLEFRYHIARWEEIYPTNLPLLFKSLYNGLFLNMDPIINLLKRYRSRNFGIYLKIPVKLNYYKEVVHFIDHDYFKYHPFQKWFVNANAELERLIARSSLN